MDTIIHNHLSRRLIRCVAFGAAFLAAEGLCRGQEVAANLLPTLTSTGVYTRAPDEQVNIVEVSESGITLECKHESPDGLQPSVWRERYSVRDGHLVLDAIFTQHVVPPVPAHTEWQMAAAIGTSNIGPAGFDPRWGNFKSYLQYVIESVQSEWLRELAQDGVRSTSGSIVTVRFRMNSKGEIAQILGVQDTGDAPAAASVPCVRAINFGAPYGNWTDDMIASLGNEQEISLSFYYQ